MLTIPIMFTAHALYREINSNNVGTPSAAMYAVVRPVAEGRRHRQ